MPWFLDGEPLPESDARVVLADGAAAIPGEGEAVGRWIAGALHVSYQGQTYILTDRAPRRGGGSGPASGDLLAPMPGAIVEVSAAVGAAVTKGQRLVVLEAMKTQQPFAAPFDGKVTAVPVSVGDQVAEGALLVKVEAVE